MSGVCHHSENFKHLKSTFAAHGSRLVKAQRIPVILVLDNTRRHDPSSTAWLGCRGLVLSSFVCSAGHCSFTQNVIDAFRVTPHLQKVFQDLAVAFGSLCHTVCIIRYQAVFTQVAPDEALAELTPLNVLEVVDVVLTLASALTAGPLARSMLEGALSFYSRSYYLSGELATTTLAHASLDETCEIGRTGKNENRMANINSAVSHVLNRPPYTSITECYLGDKYNFYCQVNNPEMDMFTHFLDWLDSYVTFLLGRPLDPEDYVFPIIGSNGFSVQPRRSMYQDMAQKINAWEKKARVPRSELFLLIVFDVVLKSGLCSHLLSRKAVGLFASM
ncbi:LOW QUALITY PROTEIN: hypothetical protein CVT26_010533 [Gymnopilus dilepis]|uniref:Uncharacterized protein n=1 Tax=Gymnopilus dilepis TaxID=231916 RepID=A0A409WRS6_9AGAR|nr:LOW QUALITY PROTEIN: hypothetical protein CVT26_010533 [Gymnopilus dilepis]